MPWRVYWHSRLPDCPGRVLRFIDLPLIPLIEALDGWPSADRSRAVQAVLIVGGLMYGAIGWLIAGRGDEANRSRLTIKRLILLMVFAQVIRIAIERPPDGPLGTGAAALYFGGLLLAGRVRWRPLEYALVVGVMHSLLAGIVVASLFVRGLTTGYEALIPLYFIDVPLVPLFTWIEGLPGDQWAVRVALSSLVAGALVHACLGLVLGILARRRSRAVDAQTSSSPGRLSTHIARRLTVPLCLAAAAVGFTLSFAGRPMDLHAELELALAEQFRDGDWESARVLMENTTWVATAGRPDARTESGDEPGGRPERFASTSTRLYLAYHGSDLEGTWRWVKRLERRQPFPPVAGPRWDTDPNTLGQIRIIRGFWDWRDGLYRIVEELPNSAETRQKAREIRDNWTGPWRPTLW